MQVIENKLNIMAEEEGFEPPCESPRKRFSRPPVSTAHPFLHNLLYTSFQSAASLRQQFQLGAKLLQPLHHFRVLDVARRRSLALNVEYPARLQHAPLHVVQRPESQIGRAHV